MPQTNHVTRVLLVEDHAQMRAIMTEMLELEGFAVTAASDVRGALDTGDRQPFDVLVSDLSLPDGSGADVIRALKPRTGVRGVAYSASSDEATTRRALDAGFDAYYVKGEPFDRLIEMIRRVAAPAPG